MASSEDEDELFPHSVTNYYFEDEDSAPVSFSVLPIWLVGKEKPNAPEKRVFLRGEHDDQKVFKEAIAYRLVLEDATPDLTVLTKDGNKWIKLLRPRKAYEASFRSILITVHSLHYLRKTPESSEKSLWDHMRRVFSSFEQSPSVNDLSHHYPLMNLLVESDNELAKCQLLHSLLEDKPRMKTFLEDHKNDVESRKSFIVDDLEDDIESDIGDESDNEIDLYDSVCAMCDNGGEILCCEGRCMRSFHATIEDGAESECDSLGYSKAQVKAIQHFVCENCEYKRHQCFICGKLGSSDKAGGAEVFACVNATCGHFYHPKCVSCLLFPGDSNQAADCETKIASGESFTCPAHKCHVCKQGENKDDRDLQFAVCRRCPKSYHRKCLPRKIAFEDDEDYTTRAWDDLLPSRILIYCLKHEIDEDLGTPIRNHIVFPRMDTKNKAVNEQKTKSEARIEKPRPVANDKRSTYQMASKQKDSFSNLKEKKSLAVKSSESSIAKQPLTFQRQSKATTIKADSQSDIFDIESKKPTKVKPVDNAASGFGGKIFLTSYPKIDSEGVNRITSLMESTSSSITLADIIKKRKMPSTHRNTSRNLDKAITWGKLEGSIEAIKTALAKLEDGGSVEDAKAVCEPNVVNLITSWSNKLRVYLAPFIHAMRYTSFGRHFTKVDKLREIADKLHWYVQNGDMIVDFCCGANDFSRLMKEKLDSVGKNCSYKNYDIIQPKFDFNYEKRDWMTVRPDELPSGSRLIMGLNPPFGTRAGLANQFIDKALTFKPKLIVLIVPSETQRLDQKRSPYDLIWEDSEYLAGKSFYLPGSVDVNDKQMEQWNNNPPPLYLWSRPDWTGKHRSIAWKQGHISKLKDKLTPEDKPQPKDMAKDSDHTFEKLDDKEIIKQDKVQKAVVESNMRSHSFKDRAVGPKTNNDNNITGEESKKESHSAENQKPDIRRTESKTNKPMDGKSKTESENKKRSRSPESKTTKAMDEKSKTASDSRKRSRSPDNHNSDKREHQKIINRDHDNKRKKMESSRKQQREIADKTKEDRDSDMSISQEETEETKYQTNLVSFVTPRATEPIHTFDRERDRRNTFDAPRVEGSFQNPYVEENIHGRQYTTSRISPATDSIYSSTYGRPEIDREHTYTGYGNTNRGSGYNYSSIGNNVGDYGRRDAPHTTMHSLSSSSSMLRTSVADKYAPRLDEMNHARSAGNFGLSGGSSAMRNPDPGLYGSAPPTVHNVRPSLYAFGMGGDNTRPDPYSLALGTESVRPNPYGLAPGTESVRSNPYGYSPHADNGGPDSYNFVPASQQRGFQHQNRDAGGWIE